MAIPTPPTSSAVRATAILRTSTPFTLLSGSTWTAPNAMPHNVLPVILGLSRYSVRSWVVVTRTELGWWSCRYSEGGTWTIAAQPATANVASNPTGSLDGRRALLFLWNLIERLSTVGVPRCVSPNPSRPSGSYPRRARLVQRGTATGGRSWGGVDAIRQPLLGVARHQGTEAKSGNNAASVQTPVRVDPSARWSLSSACSCYPGGSEGRARRPGVISSRRRTKPPKAHSSSHQHPENEALLTWRTPRFPLRRRKGR